MIVYYQDPTVQITSADIQVDDRVYPLSQLHRVWFERDQRSWRELVGRGFWSLTYLVPFVVAVIGIGLAIVLDVSFSARVIIVAAAILAGLSAGPLIDPILGNLDDSFDRGLYRHEIWIEHDGHALCLLETRDEARFGRIYRALQRAAGA